MSDLLLEEAPPQATRRPGPFDFRIYTAGVEILQPGTDLDEPVVHAIGSSNIQDLQGDVMELSALQALSRTPAGLLCFLNHSYKAPEDLAGQLTKSPWIKFEGKFADLHLDIRLFTRRNPRVLNMYQYIQDGVQMGTSVGCVVKDYTIEDDAARLHITDAESFEWSFTPLPANQRSWVEQAAKHLFERTLDERLAPIVKQLWPGDYRDIVRKVADPDQRAYLAQLPARSAPTRRLFWYPLHRAFSTKSEVGGEEDLLTREQAETLLKTQVPPPVEPETLGVAAPEPEIQKAADDADKKAQEARSHKYHIGIKEGGNVTKPGEWSDVPDEHWGDPVNYRYPMKDKAHADNAAARWADAGNRLQYSSEEQGIIERRIKARQRDFGEEPDKEKAVDPTTKKALEIAADGSHDAPDEDMEHEHAHPAYGSQGDDGAHSHLHPHKAGSASHEHPEAHDAEKSAIPSKTAASCGCCATCTGPNCGCCAQCHPDVEKSLLPAKAAAMPEAERESLIQMFDYAAEKLGVSNFKTACGLVGSPPEAQNVLSMVSQADALIDEADDVIDGLMQALGIRDIDADYDTGDMGSTYAVERLVTKLFRIETLKAGAEFSAVNKGRLQQAHDMTHGMHDHLKEMYPDIDCSYGGVQDSTASMNGSISLDDAMRQTEADSGVNLALSTLPEFTKGLQDLTAELKSLEAIKAEALAAKTDALAAKAEAESAKASMAILLKSIQKAAADASELHQEVERLTQVRIPRPTLLTRTLASDPTAATYDEMLVAGRSQDTPDSSGDTLLAQTSTEEVAGRGSCRVWPAGVGGMVLSKGGQRPELTGKQIERMTTIEVTLYEMGGAVRVPEFATFE